MSPIEEHVKSDADLVDREYRFDGGINVYDEAWAIDDNQLLQADNCLYEGNSLIKRLGSKPFKTAVPGRYGARHLITPFRDRYYVVNGDNKLYRWNSGWTEIYNGLPNVVTGGYPIRTEYFESVVIIPCIGASNTPVQVDTSTDTVSALGDLPTGIKPRIAIQWGQRLVLMGDSTLKKDGGSPSTLWYSGVGDPDDWHTNDGASNLENNEDIEAADGGEIIAAIVYYGQLFIFKDTGIWRVTGDPAFPETWEVKQVTAEYKLTQATTSAKGTARTVQLIADGIIFVNVDGRVMWTNGQDFVEVGKQIRPITEEWTARNTDNKTASSEWTGVVYKGRYYLNSEHGGDGTWGEILVYEPLEPGYGRWTRYKFAEDGTFGLNSIFYDPLEDNVYFTQGNYTKQLYQFEVPNDYTDNTLVVKMTVRTKNYFLDRLESSKRFRVTHFLRGPMKSIMHAKVFVDNVQVHPTHELPWHGKDFRDDRVYTSGRGRFIGYELETESVNPGVLIGVTLLYKERKLR